VEASAPGLLGPQGRFLLDRLEQDHDNLRLALDWAVERGEAVFALRFVASAWRFWQIRGHLREGWDRVQAALALPGVTETPAALRARALGAAGSLAYWRGFSEDAHHRYRDALGLAREIDDQSILAEAIYNFGFASQPSASWSREVSVAGLPYFNESAEIYRRIGDREGLASAKWALAQAYGDAGQPEVAMPLAEQSLELYRATGNQFGIGWALYGLAYTQFSSGRLDLALGHIVEAIQVFAAARDLSGIVGCLFGLALATREIGALEQHWPLGGAADALATRFGSVAASGAEEQYGLAPVVRPTDDAKAQRAWDTGAAMSVDEAVDYAIGVVAGLQATPQGS
jgi:tetratricopeptide (TPR) repeat protein